MPIQDFSQSEWISIIGICVTLAGLWLAWRTLTRKALSYEGRSSALLNKNALRGPIQLSLSANGVIVEDPHFAEVSIQNDGNVAIEPKDFYEPIVVSFSKMVSIVSVTIQSAQTGVSVDFTTDGNKMTLTPLLMNPGDLLVVRAIVSNKPEITLTGRISGVSDIPSRHPYSRFVDFALYGCIAFILLSIGLWIADALGYAGSANLAGTTMAIAAVLFMIASQSRPRFLYPPQQAHAPNKQK